MQRRWLQAVRGGKGMTKIVDAIADARENGRQQAALEASLVAVDARVNEAAEHARALAEQKMLRFIEKIEADAKIEPQFRLFGKVTVPLPLPKQQQKILESCQAQRKEIEDQK
jgi:hypothetical protein